MDNNLISISKIRNFTREELIDYKRSCITQEVFMDIAELCMTNGFLLIEIDFKEKDMKYHILFSNMYKKNSLIEDIAINNLDKNSGIKVLKLALKTMKEISRAKLIKKK